MFRLMSCKRQEEQKQERACEKRAVFMSLWRSTEKA